MLSNVHYECLKADNDTIKIENMPPNSQRYFNESSLLCFWMSFSKTLKFLIISGDSGSVCESLFGSRNKCLDWHRSYLLHNDNCW